MRKNQIKLDTCGLIKIIFDKKIGRQIELGRTSQDGMIQKDRQIDSQKEKELDRIRKSQKERKIDRQIDKQKKKGKVDTPTKKQIDRQIDKSIESERN